MHEWLFCLKYKSARAVEENIGTKPKLSLSHELSLDFFKDQSASRFGVVLSDLKYAIRFPKRTHKKIALFTYYNYNFFFQILLLTVVCF